MAEVIDINVFPTIETVDVTIETIIDNVLVTVQPTTDDVNINITPNLITINVNTVTGGGTTPTLQEVMETGRSYNQTIGDYTYRLEFDEADGGFISVNDNDLNTISGFQLQQGAALYFSDGISGKSTSVYSSDFGAGLVSLANTFGQNVLNIPFRTSGSGVTYFQPPNNKPAGSYTLAITDDIPSYTTPTLQEVTDVGNETTNSIIVEFNNYRSTVDTATITTLNTVTGTSIYLSTDDGIVISNSVGSARIKADDMAVGYNPTFQFPNKITDEYVIATIDDIPSLTGYVPYTGATTNVNLGEFELKAGQITLDTTPTGTAAVTTTRWNDAIGSSETTLKGGSVILKNGVDLVARVVNKVTPNTTLTKAAYQVVRVSGAQGQRLAVDLAQANNDNNSADTLGIVTETIATNQEGFIMTVGQLEGINTTGSLQGETWADGDVLYLSPTTAGRITNIKPTGATGHIVILGYVEHAHINQGKIYVKIMNGWELDELHNVYISSVANNQALTYESSTDLWKNKTIIQDSITDGVTTIAPSQNAVFDALALKQNVVSGVSDTEIGYLDGVTSAIQTQLNARCQSLYNLTSQITHTGTTAKTLLLTYLIPANTFTNGDFLNFSAIITKVANIGNTAHTLEINTTNTLTGATTISTAGFNTSNFSMKFKREIALNGGNAFVLQISNNITNDQTIGATSAISTFTYNLAANLYLFVTCTLSNATDSITYRGLSITKN